MGPKRKKPNAAVEKTSQVLETRSRRREKCDEKTEDKKTKSVSKKNSTLEEPPLKTSKVAVKRASRAVVAKQRSVSRKLASDDEPIAESSVDAAEKSKSSQGPLGSREESSRAKVIVGARRKRIREETETEIEGTPAKKQNTGNTQMTSLDKACSQNARPSRGRKKTQPVEATSKRIKSTNRKVEVKEQPVQSKQVKEKSMEKKTKSASKVNVKETLRRKGKSRVEDKSLHKTEETTGETSDSQVSRNSPLSKQRNVGKPKKAVFSTLSSKVNELKENLNPSLQTKKSLCAKDILNLLADPNPGNTESVDDGKDEEIDDEIVFKKRQEPNKTDDKISQKNSRSRPSKRAGSAKTRNLRISNPSSVPLAKPSLKSQSEQTPAKSISIVEQNGSLLNRVPIWKKPSMNVSQAEERPKKDVFDPNCYGEEEFGPDEEGTKIKKKTRRKKKDTKAILVFGDKNQRKQVENAVKESHHLKTPAARKKRIETIPRIKISPLGPEKEGALGYSSDFSVGAQNYFDSVDLLQPPSVIYSKRPLAGTSRLDSTTATAQDIHEEIDNISVEQPQKSYKTPSVPKTFSKLLKNDKSSTPKIETKAVEQKQSIKEQLKNAFGFDDTDEDLSGSESMIISPVGKMRSSILELSNRNASILRNSTALSFREPTRELSKKVGPYRYVAKPLSEIDRKLKAMEKEKIDQSIALQLKKYKKKTTSEPIVEQSRIISGSLIPATRTSPRKNITKVPDSTAEISIQDKAAKSAQEERLDQPEVRCKGSPVKNQTEHRKPIVNAVTRTSPRKRNIECEDRQTQPDPHDRQTPTDLHQVEFVETQVNSAPKDAFQVLKAANTHRNEPKKRVKKLTKKAPKLIDMDQSSISGEIISNTKRTGPSKKVQSTRTSPAKKNISNKENKDLETSGMNVTKTYRKRMDKSSVSFDSSTSVKSHKPKPSVKDKKLNAWAALQTSHFSEIDEFDISFV